MSPSAFWCAHEPLVPLKKRCARRYLSLNLMIFKQKLKDFRILRFLDLILFFSLYQIEDRW